jgi:hypothetical protein
VNELQMVPEDMFHLLFPLRTMLTPNAMMAEDHVVLATSRCPIVPVATYAHHRFIP